MTADADKINDTLTDIRVDIAEIKTMLTDVQTTKVDHETRIRKLERSVWLAAGAATAVGGTSGALVSQLFGGP